MPAKTIAVIGLGIMGSAIADNLMAAGFPVRGYDVDGKKTAALAASASSRTEYR